MKKNNDIISRRKFFKKAASAVLPAIAIAVLPNVLTSCEIDEPYIDTGGSGCTTCKGTCKGNCTGSCLGRCSGGCSSGCSSGCKTSCSSACRLACASGAYRK